jgi:UrcA family protein
MIRIIPTSRTAHLLLVATGLAMVSALAVTQESNEVTVEAARTVRQTERTYTGTPVELISLTRRVSYSDLDLTSHAGATELEKRVNDTAKAACKQLDTLYPLTSPGGDPCVKNAVTDAMKQAHAAIDAAEKSVKK